MTNQKVLTGGRRGKRSSTKIAGWSVGALGCLAVALAACAGVQTAAEATDPGPLDRRAVATAAEPERLPEEVYVCSDGFRFALAVEGRALRVWVATQSRVLEEIASSSGARFSDGEWTFWGRGAESLFEVPDGVHTGCATKPREVVWERARLRGVAFRALGNEPGWLVEISDDGVRAELDYGRTVHEFDAVELPDSGDSIALRVRDAEHRLAMAARREECSDTMSDMVYPWRVTVTIDQLELTGCGRRLDR